MTLQVLQGKRCHLSLNGESCGFSLVVAEAWGFLDCDMGLREPIVFLREIKSTFEL